MKKRVSILTFVAVALVVGLALSAGPAVAVPPVSWQPEPFDVAVPPGGRLSTQVTAIVSRDIPGTRVEVTPSLAPYVVSIEPRAFPALSKGSEVTINLVFEVASGTPKGLYEGTLHLRQASGRGNGTQAQPLSMKLTVGDLLYPPDPGEAGKETLEGIDSDEDGVRDDIQRYIELTYPDEPEVRAGLRQAAKPLQGALLDGNNKERLLQHHEGSELAEECLRALLGTEQTYDLVYDMQAEMLNTRQRSQAYLLYNKQLSGEVFHGPSVDRTTACDFNVDSLQREAR